MFLDEDCAMSNLSKRSTVYFDPAIHQALRLKAASTHRPCQIWSMKQCEFI